MGKILTTLLLILIVVLPKFCQGGFETDVKAGDIVCWRADSVEFLEIDLPIPLLEILYLTFPSFIHAYIVVDEDGTLRTSKQLDGVGSSRLAKRYEQFNLGVLIRNSALNEAQVEDILNTAHSLEGNYDYGGYNGLILDFLLSRDILRLFTSILQSPDDLYCSEFIALCFESNNIHVSARESSLTSPLDIYYYALNPFTDWGVIDIYSLE